MASVKSPSPRRLRCPRQVCWFLSTNLSSAPTAREGECVSVCVCLRLSICESQACRYTRVRTLSLRLCVLTFACPCTVGRHLLFLVAFSACSCYVATDTGVRVLSSLSRTSLATVSLAFS